MIGPNLGLTPITLIAITLSGQTFFFILFLSRCSFHYCPVVCRWADGQMFFGYYFPVVSPCLSRRSFFTLFLVVCSTLSEQMFFFLYYFPVVSPCLSRRSFLFLILFLVVCSSHQQAGTQSGAFQQHNAVKVTTVTHSPKTFFITRQTS